MNTFLFCFAVSSLLFGVVNANPDGFLRADLDGVSIGPIGSGNSSLAIVTGNKVCGGPGKFISGRVEGVCSENSNCVLVADGKGKAFEVDFEAGATISPVGLVVTSTDANGASTIVTNGTIRNSSVTTGTKYTLKAILVTNEKLQGSTVTLRLALNDPNTQTTDLCVEAPFTFTK